MMRHPSVKLQILVNKLCVLFSFRWSLFAVIRFHNDFIVMNSLFILLVIHSNYCAAGLRSLFTFWSLFAYVCMYVFVGRGFACHGTWVDIREQLAEVCFLLLPWESRDLSSDHPAWWPTPLLPEKSPWYEDWDIFQQFYEIPSPMVTHTPSF